MVNIGLLVMVLEFRGETFNREFRVLDHYYLELYDNSLAVVTGNCHYNTSIVGYVKYRLSSTEKLWRGIFGFYNRVVKQYTIPQVYGSTCWRTYAIAYGAEVPVIPVSMVKRIYDPIEKVKQIISVVRDELEIVSLEAISEIMYSTNAYNKVGLTGSLLVGIHNPRVSDIDIVVYGLKESRDVVEFINENPSIFKDMRNDGFRAWCLRVSELTGLTPTEASLFYRRWRRGVFRGREYSISYNDGIYRSMENSEKWINIGFIEGLVLFEGRLEALNYPSIGFIESFEYRGGVKPCSDPIYVLSFEALYTPVFYEGGKCMVRGLLQVNDEGVCRILVGIRETRSYIKWLV